MKAPTNWGHLYLELWFDISLASPAFMGTSRAPQFPYAFFLINSYSHDRQNTNLPNKVGLFQF